MRWVKLLPYLLLFSLVPVLLCPSALLFARDFSISLEDNVLSVTAENIPLHTILREIAGAGIRVRIDPEINPSISIHFEKRSLEQALESLLKPASYSLLWEADPSPSAQSTLRLTEIQVFRKNEKDRMELLQLQRTEVIKQNKLGVAYVQDEILLYVPPWKDRAALIELLYTYRATFVENNSFPGLLKVSLPENSDVFAIAGEIKNKLNLEISQPNYAYPIQTPVQYAAETITTDPGFGYPVPAADRAPVAILDSGLADHAALHKFVLSSLDVMNPDTSITDTLGHGTQMAFIASGLVRPYGAAPDAESLVPIIPIRAFDDNGYTTDARIMDAVNFALANNARVMSLSWGSETRSDFMEKAFAYAESKGLVLVASAGNEPTGKPVYPAAYPSVIGVGALGPHGTTWENSNYGNFVAYYAPGIARLPVGYKGGPGMYGGTSIAAAFVAHSIAGYLADNPAATPLEIRDYLQSKF